ncbi:MAG: RagB/SusD family nutrient uptake outer membrane protein [Prevotellaceae bacterium]|jgi:hypothetical protein|nr:RagB/SusD family nutrient uptake outer membrane protein [Prevotellaceae bacterium]
MKAKNFILYAVLICGILSCDVTDRIPENTFTDLNYWTKVEDMKLFSRYFYSTLSSPPGGADGYLDGNSDITVPQDAPGNFFDTRVVPTGDDGWSSGDWANIRRCNYFMTHYQTVSGDAADIDHYVAEVRFFRANEYFSKVKRFGDVPWFDKDLKDNDVELLYKGRDSRMLVIGKVIEDLEFAVEKLKLPSQVPAGQLHKYCALQMLSRVCLFEATWQKYRNAAESVWKPLMEKAAKAAKDIMDANIYSIEQGTAKYVMDNYHPLMYTGKFIQEDLTKDKECILPRIYINGILTNQLARNRSFGLSKDFIEQFLDIDGKPIALSSKYLGDDSVFMEIQNRDPRLWNIVSNRFVPLTVNEKGEPVSNLVDLPVGSGAEQNATGYTAVKFRDPNPEQWNANSTTTDWYIFRYAETLLNYAEAKYELGLCDQNVLDITVNRLRARLDYTDADGNAITMGRLNLNPPADPLATVNGKPRYGYAITPLLYEIRRERCIELSFEGFRWADICRWKAGELIENPKTMYGIAVNDDVIELYTRMNSKTDPFKDSKFATITDWDGKTKKLLRVYSDELEAKRKWNDKYYLDPLPQNQTTLNPNILPQNPGW